MRRPGKQAAAAALAVALLLGGCAAVTPPEDSPTSPSRDARSLPDPHADFDYQLGGAYDPPSGVTVIARDRTAKPAGRGYDICYVNGFQTQPGESAAFAKHHPDLLVMHDGTPLADAGWPDEFLFDTSTPTTRAALADMVGAWISGCRASGFDAVEIDNLDSYTRSEGALRAQDNIALAEEYARLAHREGLAIAQKNAADLSERLRRSGFDFAVSESCAQFAECAIYTAVYDVVLDIEYTDELGEAGFRAACDDPERPGTTILRDHDLVPPGDDGYHYERCAR